MPTDDDVFELIAAQRSALAQALDGLSDEEWMKPSLCEGWTVRDVVAHLLMGFEVSVPAVLVGVIVNRGYGRFSQRWATERAARAASPVELGEVLRENAASRFKPPGVGPAGPLAEVVVHTLDTLVPLGRTGGRVGPSAAALSLQFLVSKQATRGFVPRGRTDDLAFEAPELDWRAGTGPLITGPAPSLLLAICGRPVGLEELTGAGVEVLAERIAH